MFQQSANQCALHLAKQLRTFGDVNRARKLLSQRFALHERSQCHLSACHISRMFSPVNVNISLQSFHQPILMMCRYYCALLISYEDIRNRYTHMLSYNIIISSICVVDVVHINALKLYLFFYIYIFEGPDHLVSTITSKLILRSLHQQRQRLALRW